ncbi:MAG: glycosyltransferase family 4 protein [Bacteroidetes bacterium]|nr:glycosyltransferase family 4 protein [Bacteroidota bacterium]
MNPEAPFQFQPHPGIHYYDRDVLGMEGIYEIINKQNIDIVIVSGWSDKIYNKIIRMFDRNLSVVLCFDNLWKGTLRQLLLLPFARYYLRRLYSAAWVPGDIQADFAEKIGFGAEEIYTGFYATDTGKFRKMGMSRIPEGKRRRRFLCVARYIPEKGYDLLWKAFIELKKEYPNDWELWCAGTGVLYDRRTLHPDIKHLGFVQPQEMGPVIEQTDVFVLTSYSEPWGMVVQEYAAAGYPLILSSAVGSGTVFLRPGENGFVFDSGNKEELKEAMIRTMKMSESELQKMSAISAELGMAYDAVNWVKTLKQLGTNYGRKR